MNRQSALLAAAVLILGLTLCFHLALPSGPQVVITMPKDAKPLSELDKHPEVVGPERATLWWTVYKETRSSAGSQSAANIADQAVRTVYGPTPSHP